MDTLGFLSISNVFLPPFPFPATNTCLFNVQNDKMQTEKNSFLHLPTHSRASAYTRTHKKAKTHSYTRYAYSYAQTHSPAQWEKMDLGNKRSSSNYFTVRVRIFMNLCTILAMGVCSYCVQHREKVYLTNFTSSKFVSAVQPIWKRTAS